MSMHLHINYVNKINMIVPPLINFKKTYSIKNSDELVKRADLFQPKNIK